MPCRYEEYEDSTEDVLKAKIDELTQNLCFLCGAITENKLWNMLHNSRISQWWIEHQTNDTKRVTEAIRAYVIKHPRTMATNIANRFIRDAEAVHPVSDFHRRWFYDITKKEVDFYRANKKSKNGMKASITNKLTPDEIAYIRMHKV